MHRCLIKNFKIDSFEHIPEVNYTSQSCTQTLSHKCIDTNLKGKTQ
uniref:Uncharacterized protein n=1 Tax=Rhizophora mucronata TaxID=61149 RepID=A0A2P2PMM6_RHIMU